MNFFRKLFGLGPKPASSAPTPAPASNPTPAPVASTGPTPAAPLPPVTASVSPVHSPAPAPRPSAPLEITLLTVDGPVWLPPDSPAVELFPAKGDDVSVVAFLGGSAEVDLEVARSAPDRVDEAARFARALPLFLTEHIEFHTSALARTLVAWVVQPNPGFILGGAQWDDATAARHARQAGGDDPADYLVVTHLICRDEPWTIELRLVRTVDAACLATLTIACQPKNPASALAELARQLLAALDTHASVAGPASPGAPEFLPAPSRDYLRRLEQLLGVRTAALDPSGKTLRGEADIVKDQFSLCAEHPDKLAPRLLLAHTLQGLKRLRPGLVAGFRERALELQAAHPLPEPAQAIVARILADTFAS